VVLITHTEPSQPSMAQPALDWVFVATQDASMASAGTAIPGHRA
jgi:hypothetical protein